MLVLSVSQTVSEGCQTYKWKCSKIEVVFAFEPVSAIVEL